MAVNVWKASTLVLAGALVLVLGRGAAVSSSQACPTDDEDAAMRSKTRLNAAISLVDRASMNVENASTGGQHRMEAARHLSLARMELARAVQPVMRPRPMMKHADAL